MSNTTDSINLFIRLPNGNGCMLKSRLSITLQSLASQIKQTTLQLPTSFRLVYRGKRIKDYSLTIDELDIANNSIIHVQPASSISYRSTKIDVAFLINGDKFVVREELKKTIWELKQAISEMTNISPKEQTLVFLGKKLKNDRTLEHYKLTSDSLLCLITQNQQKISKQQVRFYQGIDLTNSVFSVAQKKSGVSKTTLFRSDSINKRNIEQIAPYQIQITQKKVKAYQKQASLCRIELFKSCKQINLLKESLTFNNLFQSLGFPTHEQIQDNVQEQQQFQIQKQIRKIPIAKMDLSVGQEYKSIQLDD